MYSFFLFDYILDLNAPPPTPPPPPAHKISNNILIYLTSYRILQLAPPSPCHQDIVNYCEVWGGGAWGGGRQILQKIMAPPLSVIKIVKYCGVVGGGGH